MSRTTKKTWSDRELEKRIPALESGIVKFMVARYHEYGGKGDPFHDRIVERLESALSPEQLDAWKERELRTSTAMREAAP